MRGEYQLEEHVRLARRLVWTIGGVLLVVVLLALAWQIAQVSERRAQQATREYLASSLISLTAEQLAQDRLLTRGMLTANPFQLLRWQQDNYCGELARGDTPASGCWYWLAEPGWVLYRWRFSDGWAEDSTELQAYRVQAVPQATAAGAHWQGRGLALEFQAVPQAQLAAQGLIE